MNENNKVLPFLKWAGGKRWLTYLTDDFRFSGKYIEPFAGSGAMYFALKPKKAVLCDANDDLILTYRMVRDRPEAIGDLLRKHQEKHSHNHYYEVRANMSIEGIERAADFIYLNRTCWNGLYRVNRRGLFNVPIGTKNTVMLPSDDWLGVSRLLKGTKLISGDFEDAIRLAKPGDLIFADPPYTVKHNLNGFVKYNESIFAWQDQVRLATALASAAARGVVIVSTNAAHQSVMDLYGKPFAIQKLNRRNVLAGKASARGVYEELLITANYE